MRQGFSSPEQAVRPGSSGPNPLQAAPRHRAGRMKQWLNLLRRRHPEAQAAFDAVRTVTEPAQVEALLFGAALSGQGHVVA